MKTHRHITLFTLTSLILGGCVIEEQDVLFNNSGQTVTLHLGQNEDFKSQVVEQGRRGDFYSPFLRIQTPTTNWYYERKPMVMELHGKRGAKPRDFYETIPGNRILVKLQLQPDGSIYIIPRSSGFPAEPLPKQPEAFPLKPMQHE